MFVRAEWSAAAQPSEARHPGHGRNRCRPANVGRRRSVPAPEVRPRAPGVDARRRAQVLSEVEQHVDHADPHLPGRRERPRVIAIAYDGSLAAEAPVHGERQSDRQAVNAAAHTSRIVTFDDEVAVVLLDGEMNDPKPVERCAGDGPLDGREHPRRAERRKSCRRSHRDLDRMPWVDLRTELVWHRRPAARLPTCALADATPGLRAREPELHVPPPRRLDSAHVWFSTRTGAGCVCWNLERRCFRSKGEARDRKARPGIERRGPGSKCEAPDLVRRGRH